MKRALLFGLTALSALYAQEFTRGVGVYPGDPKDYFGPSLAADAAAYRNLAFHRPAYHSSSYDYNLTAQLVTDGIKETALPPTLTVTASGQPAPLPKAQRESLVGDGRGVGATATGPNPWIQFQFAGGSRPLEIDRIDVTTGGAGGRGNPRPPAPAQPQSWAAAVSTSDDGQTWKEAGRARGAAGLDSQSTASIGLGATLRSRYYRIALEAQGAATWRVGKVWFYNKNSRVQLAGPGLFHSAWESAGQGEEWVYVDLGAACTFDRVALAWNRRPAEGSLQASDDAAAWKTLQPLPAATGLNDDIKLAQPAKARYVRVLMTKSTGDNYILSELEVWGRGGPLARPHAAAAAQAGGRMDLAGGGWRLQRDSLVPAGGEALSQPGFDDREWVIATVPGTVLTSYINVGAVPDPNFGDNLNMISDSFFYADFWYRDEFTAPASAAGRRYWLNFDGINWKAEVFFNGARLGRIEGGFMRGRFDVSKLIHAGGKNAVAVRIEKNANPGGIKDRTMQSTNVNGGVLGADNPTYHASIGWDWIPPIRGRNIGVWSNVYLTPSGPVTIDNPLVSTTLPLPDTSRADVSIEATLTNHDSAPVTGEFSGTFGAAALRTSVTIPAGGSKVVKLDPASAPALRLSNPKLWWPAGYGDQNLYPVKLAFTTGARQVSDEKTFQAGVRQFTYSEDNTTLRIWINGRRFIARGGNWGFPEAHLRYRAREYDIAVRYHKEMNFTMIRNWVGQTGDEPFYDACDKYGIVVWQDFWLANPADGPSPDDNDLFLKNARDYVLRIRNHASIGLYCGRNEGIPPKPIDDGLRALVAGLHPGLHYIPSSAEDDNRGATPYVVTGHGPYQAQAIKSYFTDRATPKMHSEMGMPNVPTLDSVKLMMPEAALWPRNITWAYHDFTTAGAQAGASFARIVDASYGNAKDAGEFLTLAQFVNYDGHRAMFEAQSKNRMGLLIWMSHSCWPSFVWQTYDYYFEPTAAYFGMKKANEPLHIQWNAATDNIEVVNYSGGAAKGLTATVQLLNMDGSVKWEKSAPVDSPEDSVQTPIKMEYPAGLTPTHFIRLKLARAGQEISQNFYLHGLEEVNFKAIRDLPKVKLEASTRVERQGANWVLTTELRNPSAQPALMVRLKAVREQSGDRILPAIYSDNYIALMPGERRSIRTELANADTRGERPRMAVEGFNTGEVTER